MTPRRARFVHLAAFALALLGSPGFTGAALAAPPRASEPVADPGKGITNGDDASTIARNPANLAFMPGAELRLGLVWTGSASPLPNRGGDIAFAVPIGPFATGLRLDLLSPPDGAPAPFDAAYHWVRWGLALGSEQVALGHTFAWGLSRSALLDGYFSMSTGLTLRPTPWLSASIVARDWNEPARGAIPVLSGLAGAAGATTGARVGSAASGATGSLGALGGLGSLYSSGSTIERSWVFGIGGRPFGTRVLEAAWDLTYLERSQAFEAHGMLAFDVPRVGRVRGNLTVLPQTDRRFLATAGVEVNLDRLQVSGGAVFGDAVGKSGAGLYFGAAIRSFREPGLRLPAKVVRVKIDGTPGVRGNTRLLRKLWRLADDPEVEGVVLQLRAEPASSVAHAEEVADAVRLLRARGKKVMCHLEDAGGKSLYVCSQADRIAMNPAGGLRFAGVGSSYYYFGGLLKKLGVRADFVRIGPHKLAAEQLTMPGGSPEAQKDHQELVDQIHAEYLRAIGAGRGMSAGELTARLAKGPFLASEARAEKLIDTLAYEDEIERFAAEVMAKPVKLTDDAATPKAPQHWGKGPKVAVVYLSGDMVDGESQFIPLLNVRLAGSTTIAKALKKAREDDSVKSVVFRIETGGGSSLAADVILREAILTAKKKPLVVSMGTSAASGGYYAAVAGREIFANRATMTGSIGIFYGKADVVGLLDKIGVRVEQFRSAPRADAESFFRPFSDDERRELGVKVKQFYDLFVARVAEGRHMSPEAVDAVGRGKVWTGQQALGKGLVTRLGGLREALAEARRLGRLPEGTPIVESPEEDDSLLGFLLNLVGIHAQGGGALGSIPPALLPLAQLVAPFLVFEPGKPLARAELVDESFGSAEAREP